MRPVIRVPINPSAAEFRLRRIGGGAGTPPPARGLSGNRIRPDVNASPEGGRPELAARRRFHETDLQEASVRAETRAVCALKYVNVVIIKCYIRKNRYQLVQTGTNRYALVRTGTDRYAAVRVGTVWNEAGRSGKRKCTNERNPELGTKELRNCQWHKKPRAFLITGYWLLRKQPSTPNTNARRLRPEAAGPRVPGSSVPRSCFGYGTSAAVAG